MGAGNDPACGCLPEHLGQSDEGDYTAIDQVTQGVSWPDRGKLIYVAHSSQHDPLTGLPNCLLLVDRIGQAINLAKRNQNDVAILFLDLDGFKQINDSLGHQTGDKMLQSIGDRLSRAVRAPDTVSSQGGNEFVVLLQEVRSAQDIVNAAHRVMLSIAGTYDIDVHALRVSASMGISIYPADGMGPKSLVKNADIACTRRST